MKCAIGCCCALFHGDGLGEVARHVDVAAPHDGDVVGDELQGDDVEDGGEVLEGFGQLDDVLRQADDLGVAGVDEGDDVALARLYLLDVGDDFVVVVVLGGDGEHGHVFVDEGDGAVLHFGGGVALGVDVGDFL